MSIKVYYYFDNRDKMSTGVFKEGIFDDIAIRP